MKMVRKGQIRCLANATSLVRSITSSRFSELLPNRSIEVTPTCDRSVWDALRSAEPEMTGSGIGDLLVSLTPWRYPRTCHSAEASVITSKPAISYHFR
jgi:hypothetical protein